MDAPECQEDLEESDIQRENHPKPQENLDGTFTSLSGSERESQFPGSHKKQSRECKIRSDNEVSNSDMGSRITARTVTQTSLVTDSNVCSDSDQNIKLLKESNHVSSESVSLNQSMAIYACTGNVEGVISLTDRGINVNSFDERGLTPLHNATSKNDTSMIVVLVDRGAMVDAPTSRESSFPGVTPLHVAAIFGNEEAIRTLHKLGASLNIQDSAGNTPLHICINKGNRDLARCLISLGADVTVCGDNGSALHHAAELGNIEMIWLLVNYGCPPTIASTDNWTPADVARQNGHLKVATLLESLATTNLLAAVKCQTGIVDHRGYAPVHYAVCYNNIFLLKELLHSNETDLNMLTYLPHSLLNVAPIHIAVIMQHTLVLLILAKAGADLNLQDSDGNTPLHYCVDTGDRDLARCLISLGADVAVCGDNGSALHHAAELGNIEMNNLLVESGCPLNNSDTENKSLSDLAKQDDCLEVVSPLQKSSVKDSDVDFLSSDINSLDVGGYAAIHYATCHNDITLVQWLCLYGADINLLTHLPHSLLNVAPIHIAVILGHTLVLLILAKAGADLNIQDSDGDTPLHYCVDRGDRDLARCLISLGADVTVCGDNGSALHHAAELGNIEMIHLLVDNGCPPDIQDGQGATPADLAVRSGMVDVVVALRKIAEGFIICAENMCLAAANDDIELLHLMIGIGVPVDIKDKDGITPLYFAAVSGSLMTCKVLILYGAAVNVTDPNGFTPLMRAAKMGQKDIVLFLIRNGADVTWLADDFGGAIHQAAVSGQGHIIKYLIDNGCPVDLQISSCNATPMHFASNNEGALNSCMELISLGADVNARTNEEQTPLILASQQGHKDIVLCLINNGADITWVAKDIGGAIHQAAFNGHVSVICCLVDKGCPVDLRTEYGTTSLHFASSKGALNSCIELISLGADVNARDDGEQTPLILASQQGHKDIVLYLINNGADITWVAKDVGGAIHQAAFNGHVSVICCLVDKGCPVDLRAEYGTTSLHAASSKGALNSCIELISLGADVNARDDGEKTPLILASLNGHKDLVLYLIYNGSDITWVAKDVGGAIHQAAFNGHCYIINCLIENGCPVDLRDENNSTALHYATLCKSKSVQLIGDAGLPSDSFFDADGPTSLPCFSVHKQAILILAKAGADLNIQNSDGDTPLHYCVDRGNRDLARCLISLGADVTVCGENGSALHRAAELGNIEMIHLLVDSGCPPDIQDGRGATPTDWAFSYGKLVAVVTLNELAESYMGYTKTFLLIGNEINTLKSMMPIDSRDKNGCAWIINKLYSESFSLCKSLIFLGFNVNAKKNTGFTPVMVACRLGQADVYLLLLDSYADVLWVSKGGGIHKAAIFYYFHMYITKYLADRGCPVELCMDNAIALHYASDRAVLSACKELIALGANLNLNTPLLMASVAGHEDLVLHFIKAGADVTHLSKEYGGAIHAAAATGHINVIKCLIDNGCPVDLRDENNQTPLHCSSAKSVLTVCKELIALGADVNTKDNKGLTPLILASQQGHKDIVLYLINNGADISWVAKECGGAIHQAAKSGYVHIIKCLVDIALCPIDLKSEEVYTPLHYACIGGALNVCKELVALGADVNAKNGEGKTPLIVASQYGHEEVVQCLIDNGADTALMMKADGGALHQAAGLGRTEVVTCLIRNGVSVNQLTSKGHSPLYYAAIGGSKDICELLLSTMKDPARHVDVLAGLGSNKFSSAEQIIKWYMLCKDMCFKFLQSKLSDEVYSLREAWEVFYSETFANFLWHMIFHRDHDEIKEIITKVLQGFISIFSNLSKSDYIRMNSRLLHGAAFYGTFDMISMLPNFSYELREHKNVCDFALMYFKGQDYSSRFTSVTPLHVCLHVLDIEKLNVHVQSIYLTFIGKMVLVDPGIVHDQLPDGSTPLDLAIKFELYEAVSIIHAAGGQTNPFTITRRETLSQELKQCYDTMYQKILLINTVSDRFQQRKIAEDIVEMLKSTFQIDTSVREAKEPYLETKPTKEQLLQIVAPKIEDRWYKVATFLDLDEDYIDDVREDKSLSKSDKCFVILKKWLKSDPNPTWRVLVDAISKTDVTFQIKSHLDRTEAKIRSSDSQVGQLCTLAQNRANRELDFGHSKIFNLPPKQLSFVSPYSIAVFNNIILPQVAARWEFFAYSLGVEVELVKIIKTNHPTDVERCCGNLFIRWLNSDRNTGGKPRNWETVKTALLDSHHEKVCDNLEALLSSGSQSEMIGYSEDQNNINVSLGSIPTMVTRDNVGMVIPIEDRNYIEPAPPHRLQGETSPVDLDPSDLPISQSCISIINNIVIHEVAAEWEKVGIYLGFNIAVLKTIERTFVHSDRLVYCCKEMFEKWLTKDYGSGDLPRTWRTVVIAIRESGYGALAEDLWTGRYQPS